MSVCVARAFSASTTAGRCTWLPPYLSLHASISRRVFRERGGGDGGGGTEGVAGPKGEQRTMLLQL